MEFTPIFFPIFLFWAIALLFYLFRPDTDKVWKAVPFVFFLASAVWFYDNIIESFALYRQKIDVAVPAFFTSMSGVISTSLLLIWPLAIVHTLFLRSQNGVKNTVKALSLFTVFFLCMLLVDYAAPPFVGKLIRTLPGQISNWLRSIPSPP